MSALRPAGVAVVIPVHDEEVLLGAALQAVDEAGARAVAQGIAVRVAVVLDRCTDGSEAVAGAHAVRARVPTLAVDVPCGNVGAARAAGVDAALAALDLAPAAVWIATTDADSRVPASWLVDQLALAASGADAVAGVVSVEDWSEHLPSVPVRYLRRYSPRSPHPHPNGHPHVHGANLGVRGDAYRHVGGFPALASSEDVALWQAVGDAGYRRVSTRAISVITSARASGRAPDGFAAHLRSLVAGD